MKNTYIREEWTLEILGSWVGGGGVCQTKMNKIIWLYFEWGFLTRVESSWGLERDNLRLGKVSQKLGKLSFNYGV